MGQALTRVPEQAPVERTWIPPFRDAELSDPVGAGRLEDLVKLADETAGDLTGHYGFKRYPLHRKPNVEPRRFVCIDELGKDVALGVFLSVADQLGSPMAVMIHRNAPRAAALVLAGGKPDGTSLPMTATPTYPYSCR